MPRYLTSLAAALLVGLPLSGGAALAAGGGGGGGGSETMDCPAGQVYDKSTKKCVAKSSALDTETLFEAGRSLAYAGKYDEAISVLRLAEGRKQPGIYNMLGYAHRKKGRLLIALGYYEEALRLDPDHVLTREYLGEAHLQMGDLAAAREQLGEIAKRCGTGCAEYAELDRHITAFERDNG